MGTSAFLLIIAKTQIHHLSKVRLANRRGKKR